MGTISLWQPYASLVAIGAKPDETRHWPPSPRYIGKRIAIHAAKRKPTRNEMDGFFDEAADAFGFCHWHLRIPYGAVVCTAVLRGAYQVGGYHGGVVMVKNHIAGSPSLTTITPNIFGDYGEDRWIWQLENIEPLKDPVPFKGKQGWFQWQP